MNTPGIAEDCNRWKAGRSRQNAIRVLSGEGGLPERLGAAALFPSSVGSREWGLASISDPQPRTPNPCYVQPECALVVVVAVGVPVEDVVGLVGHQRRLADVC